MALHIGVRDAGLLVCENQDIEYQTLVNCVKLDELEIGLFFVHDLEVALGNLYASIVTSHS